MTISIYDSYPVPQISKFQSLSASQRLCGKLSVNFSSIGEEIGNNIGIARCRIEGAEEFTLNVLGESSSLATPLNHLMGDLFGGGGDQIVRLQPQFRHQAVQGLFSEIPF
jgi:hypothetical protein